MRIIDGSTGLPRVKFGSVGVGECFYYRDRLHIKGAARLENNALLNCGGLMTHFGFDPESGAVTPFQSETEVIPAKAHVQVEEVGRFN